MVQIHHIIPEAEGGPGTYENGIPVCLDCHAEIESTSRHGRRFTADELRAHRDKWFALVKNQPEALLRGKQEKAETGPLESLMSELDFNCRIVSDLPDVGFPPLEMAQFRRAIAANALAQLTEEAREAITTAYRKASMVNYLFDKLLNLRVEASDHQATEKVRNQIRNELRDSLIPFAIRQLQAALGEPSDLEA